MSTGRKILVLESDRAAAFVLTAGLRRKGWIVVSAHDPGTAMTVARRQQPDAVLLTSRMRDEGLAAVRRLRSSVYTASIPVICVAERNGQQETLLAAGVQEMVDPPGDAGAIDEALRRHLSRGEVPLQVPQSVLGSPGRLKALEESRLVDTPPDDRLDRVTRIAGRIAGAPLARLSMVTSDRQFFKSQVALSETAPVLRETPLSNSICQWVVGGAEDVVVEDARQDPVLRSNLAVKVDGAVAYAGVPFTLDGEQILGSFCVVDTEPHAWSEDQVASLRDLALVLRAWAGREDDMRTTTSAIAAAANVLLREHAGCGEAERAELCQIVHELSTRLLVQVPERSDSRAFAR